MLSMDDSERNALRRGLIEARVALADAVRICMVSKPGSSVRMLLPQIYREALLADNKGETAPDEVVEAVPHGDRPPNADDRGTTHAAGGTTAHTVPDTNAEDNLSDAATMSVGAAARAPPATGIALKAGVTAPETTLPVDTGPAVRLESPGAPSPGEHHHQTEIRGFVVTAQAADSDPAADDLHSSAAEPPTNTPTRFSVMDQPLSPGPSSPDNAAVFTLDGGHGPDHEAEADVAAAAAEVRLSGPKIAVPETIAGDAAAEAADPPKEHRFSTTVLRTASDTMTEQWTPSRKPDDTASSAARHGPTWPQQVPPWYHQMFLDRSGAVSEEEASPRFDMDTMTHGEVDLMVLRVEEKSAEIHDQFEQLLRIQECMSDSCGCSTVALGTGACETLGEDGDQTPTLGKAKAWIDEMRRCLVASVDTTERYAVCGPVFGHDYATHARDGR